MSITVPSSGVPSRTKGTRRRTVAQALVEYLQVQYSELDGRQMRLIAGLYAIFGHGNSVGLAQGLDEYGVDFPHYPGKNEQSMVHAAIGYAKATRRMSTFACTASAGPGSINMVTGAATASTNRLPVLLLPADVITNRRADPVLQQIEHPVDRDVSANDCFRPVSRYFDRLVHPEQLLSTMPEAMRVLTDPVETGAVTVCLPQDIQGEVFDFPESFFEPRVWPIVRRPPAEQELDAALEVLAESKRPLIVVGGGVRYSHAEDVVGRVSSDLGIPVSETYAGKGCGPADEMNLGGLGVTGTIGAARIAAAADCVLCIGTRLQDFVTASHSLFENPDVRFVSVNVGSFDAHKVGALPVIGDAQLVVSALHKGLAERGFVTSESYRREVAGAQEETEALLRADLGPHAGEKMSQAEVVHALNGVTGADDAIVLGSGGIVEMVHKLWDTSNGSEVHIEYAFSCMGHEIPAGIGYRMARGDRPGEVFVLIGDGTYLMQPTELVTAVQEHAKVIVVVVNNHGNQCIGGLQKAKTGVEFGTQLRERSAESGRLDGAVVNVDFVANAESMGCSAWRATTPEEFTAAVAEARNAAGPALIEAEIDPLRGLTPIGVFWDVGVALASEREEALALATEHDENRRRQRFYGATSAGVTND